MRKPARKAVVGTASSVAPVGGLNARDALANMPPEDAVILDNWLPDATSVYLRNGYTSWATGFPGAVKTLMTYSAGAARKLFGEHLPHVKLSIHPAAANPSRALEEWLNRKPNA